ncbi:hypothetical protein F4813DRAFT_154029 [Daldinia decipiens]|uniref:uncharacterized protein n=1 Tax=Daldinia decipiens TaxID=326647 RepID=UPI0020C28B33|nr:uncharacterized protein F4813DRAFT_154029 [Daldinia decipiens]KAI1655791.1 hypothetical protein F4813DRAFT_154029 [Daldinia decipiens]
MPHNSKRPSSSSKPGASDEYPSTIISSVPHNAAYTGDNRVPYNERIRSLRRSPSGHKNETTPDGSLASVPPTSDPREPRPPVSHPPLTLSTLANSTQVTETAESLRSLRLSLAGLESNGKNDDRLFDRRVHDAKEASAKKKSIDTADERRHKRTGQPPAPLSRKIAVPISAEMAEALMDGLDELFGRGSKKSDGKKKDDGKKKHDGKDKKHHKRDDKKDDDHKSRKDGQTQT